VYEYIIIGNLDKDKFKEIAGNIISDEIVITYKQIGHINQRRKGIYDKYKNDLLYIINNPDYIFKDKHKDTALITKRMERHVQIVLKLVTDKDSEYKNSIITMWEINDKRLKEYIRNEKVIYNKE